MLRLTLTPSLTIVRHGTVCHSRAARDRTEAAQVTLVWLGVGLGLGLGMRLGLGLRLRA